MSRTHDSETLPSNTNVYFCVLFYRFHVTKDWYPRTWKIQGAYTRSPRYVRSLLSKTFFNLPPMSRTRFLHSFKPGQLPAAVQHSEHAFEAALTVSNSSSFLV